MHRLTFQNQVLFSATIPALCWKEYTPWSWNVDKIYRHDLNSLLLHSSTYIFVAYVTCINKWVISEVFLNRYATHLFVTKKKLIPPPHNAFFYRSNYEQIILSTKEARLSRQNVIVKRHIRHTLWEYVNQWQPNICGAFSCLWYWCDGEYQRYM